MCYIDTIVRVCIKRQKQLIEHLATAHACKSSIMPDGILTFIGSSSLFITTEMSYMGI